MGENQADEITAPVALLIKSMSYNLVFTTNLKLYLTFVALITFTGERVRNDTEKMALNLNAWRIHGRTASWRK